MSNCCLKTFLACSSACSKVQLISNHLCLSAAGLAVGLGIGAIAEVAKQSLGGKQKGGTNILSPLTIFCAILLSHPVVFFTFSPEHVLLKQQTDQPWRIF